MKQVINKNFTLGILGGMGPLAGVELQKKIIELSPAQKDQDHLKMVCYTNPHINDRTVCLANGEDFSLSIATSLNQLKIFGAAVGVIACNTAHAQIEQIQDQSSLPLVNLVEETVKSLMVNFSGAKKIGLLATDGTIQSGVYDKYLKEYGLEIILPDKKMQEIIMQLIYSNTGLKLGFVDSQINIFVLNALVNDLYTKGADAVILGCTELSLLELDDNKTIDPLKVVALKVIEMAYG
jgi:aspartate racemase